MPIRWFKCPDGETIECEECLKLGGCRMEQRCATRPYLRLVADEREFDGKVTPSAAGNGPLLTYLKGVTDYAVSPQDKAFASFGTATHGKLSIHKYTKDVLAEEEMSDEKMKGIADVVDECENGKEGFILYDYKTWGSYKLMKALGGYQVNEPVLDDHGNQIIYKSGKKKGEVKTHKVTYFDPERVLKNDELFNEEMQLGRYGIFFTDKGFPVVELWIQGIPRDGGTYIADSRGITEKVYMIPLRMRSREEILSFYDNLQDEVDTAVATGQCRLCNARECWEGRRCEGYCEVAEACKQRYDRPDGWKGGDK